MTKTIEVIYEDKVLKPISSLDGLKEHEKMTVIICTRTNKEGIRNLIGTLTHKEATAMKEIIHREFEKVEGEW